MIPTLPSSTTHLTHLTNTGIKAAENTISDKPSKESTPFRKKSHILSKDCKSLDERYFEYQTLRCNYPELIPIAFENYRNSPKNKLSDKAINFRFYIAKSIKAGKLLSLICI